MPTILTVKNKIINYAKVFPENHKYSVEDMFRVSLRQYMDIINSRLYFEYIRFNNILKKKFTELMMHSDLSVRLTINTCLFYMNIRLQLINRLSYNIVMMCGITSLYYLSYSVF